MRVAAIVPNFAVCTAHPVALNKVNIKSAEYDTIEGRKNSKKVIEEENVLLVKFDQLIIKVASLSQSK